MAPTDKASTRDRLLDAAAELKDPEHSASVVARGAKERLQDFFHAQAEEGGARDPQLLARRLMLVLDGGGARAGGAEGERAGGGEGRVAGRTRPP